MIKIKITEKATDSLEWNFLHIKEGLLNKYSVLVFSLPLLDRILTLKY